jgi:hypothetical protein
MDGPIFTSALTAAMQAAWSHHRDKGRFLRDRTVPDYEVTAQDGELSRNE